MTDIKLTTEGGSLVKGDSQTLICPHCGVFYLHHGKIEVYDRDEDDLVSLKVTIGSPLKTATCAIVDSLENPSKRRDGMRIHFWCEGCDKQPTLAIVQHKGITYMYWE